MIDRVPEELWTRFIQEAVIKTILKKKKCKKAKWLSEEEELQAGIKMTRRNINNLKCGDDTSLMKESKEELKSLLMRVKEES